MLKKDSIQTFFLIIVASVLALVLFQISNVENSRHNMLMVIPLAWFIYVMYRRAMNTSRQTVLLTGLLSLMWSTVTVVADKIDLESSSFVENFAYEDIFEIIVFGFAVFPIFYCIIEFFTQSTERIDGRKRFSVKNWLVFTFVYIVCWMPVFLTYYPGNLSVDSFDVTLQALGQTRLSNHHPVMFTILVRICMKFGAIFGGITAGIVLFSILQMVIQALTLAFCTEKIRSYGANQVLLVASVLFSSFSPIISMYSITMWKDILFSCWLLLLVLYLFELLHGEENRKELRARELGIIVFLNVLIAFGRNNGFYIIFLTSLVLCFYYRKQYKRVVPVLASSLVLISIVQGPIYDMCEIEKGSFAESVGIPLQQMAYTVKYDGNITEEQRVFLDHILPLEEMKEAYCPTVSNGIKFHQDFNDAFLEENKGEFLKVWLEMLIHNPFKFVKAYCLQTMGFWHIDTVGYVYASGVSDTRYNTLGVTGRNLWKELTGIEIDCTEHWHEPILNLFLSPSVPFWLILICAVVLIVRKQYPLLISLVPLIGLWGTIMVATPAFGEFRYVYGLYLAIPFLFFLLSYHGERQRESRE